MTTSKGRIGILVGGGPAPGINSVISAATIEAINRGYEVVGIFDGYAGLMDGGPERFRDLYISDVSRIHTQGGSILRTSRASLTGEEDGPARCFANLRARGIGALLTIGGDGTASGAYEVSRATGGAVRTVHVPKTIDNDLPLPADRPTFGYETARHVGTQIVMNLMEDSRTTGRWFFVIAMGRKAGHLALGIGKSAGATVTIVPEEFPSETIGVDDVCRVLEGAILKREAMGRGDGVAVVAEGVLEKLEDAELEALAGESAERDHYGQIRLGELPLGLVLRRAMQRRMRERGRSLQFVDVVLGYELRCAPAIPFDIDYTRDLGHGAVRFLTSDTLDGDDALRFGGMVCLEGGQLRVLPFEQIRDPASGRTRVRYVDLGSEHYRVARQYMIRLNRRDLEDPEMLARLAAAANMTHGSLHGRVLRRGDRPGRARGGDGGVSDGGLRLRCMLRQCIQHRTIMHDGSP